MNKTEYSNKLNHLDFIESYIERLNTEKDQSDVISELKESIKLRDLLEIYNQIEKNDPLKDRVLCMINLYESDTNDLIKTSILSNEDTIVHKINTQLINSNPVEKEVAAINLSSVPGHPLRLFHKENIEIEKLIEETKKELIYGLDIGECLNNLKPIEIHYSKKNDLLYPFLMNHFLLPENIDSMWLMDKQIINNLNSLINNESHNNVWKNKALDLIKNIEEMVFNEENVLFPLIAVTFNTNDWELLNRRLNDYPKIFGITRSPWIKEQAQNNEIEITNDEIILPGGKLNLNELRAILKTLPYEITFIDENDLNKYFNEGSKVFKHPLVDLGLNALSCHPPKMEKVVRTIFEDFKTGKRDKDSIWIEKDNKPFLLTYIAVRNNKGNYIGTLVTVQAMDLIEQYFEKKFA